MRCPYCLFPNTSVQETRAMKQGNGVRRKRKCNQCEQKFITTELAQANTLMVIKNNGSREVFDPKKIEQAVYSAFRHKANHLYIERITANIVRSIEQKYLHTIPSRDIGVTVLRHLHKTDNAAYIRFVAWNKEFSTLQEFVKACHSLSSTND